MSNVIGNIRKNKGYKKLNKVATKLDKMTATEAITIILELAENNIIKLDHKDMTKEQIREQALQINALLIMKRVRQYIIKGESNNV